jgi:hypothetical protein
MAMKEIVYDKKRKRKEKKKSHIVLSKRRKNPITQINKKT